MNTNNEFKIILQICPETLAVCRLPPNSKLPLWLTTEEDSFTSITKTSEELSIVCSQTLVPNNVTAKRNWRMLKIKGQLDFALVGILHRVITPLSEGGISIYALSTYDTDYILIQQNDFENALKFLSAQFIIEKGAID